MPYISKRETITWLNVNKLQRRLVLGESTGQFQMNNTDVEIQTKFEIPTEGFHQQNARKYLNRNFIKCH